MSISMEQIRKKGKSLGYSYVQSLSLYLFEEILCWMNQSELKDQLWLKWEEFQMKGRNKKPIPNEIVYYMKDISYQTLENVMTKMVKARKNHDMIMECQLLFFDLQIEIVLDCQMEQITVPFKIVIRPIWQEDQFPMEGSYQLQFSENTTVTYQAYPMELNLAECFYEILDRLELIGDMKAYDVAWCILKNHPVDGRRSYLEVKELLEKRPIASLEKRWETILSYAQYGYMEKRWKKYHKGNKGEVPSWKNVIELLEEFFTPMWQAIEENGIFFGDWMPQLGRYLE